MKKDLLSINTLSKQEIEKLISSAVSLKKKLKAGTPHQPLKGKTLGLLFEKPSTRTRVSFEIGMLQLGGYALYLSWRETQLGREESPEDTARVLSRYLDGMVIRTFSQSTLETCAHYAAIPVINGLTDLFHPCQILSDLMTVAEKKGDFKKAKIAYIGDGNNIANSWINASLKLGFILHLACPEGYEPDRETLKKTKEDPSSQITLSADPGEAARDADIIYTDTWVSMGQENEHQKRLEAFKGYQVNSSLLKAAKGEVMVMHCLPAHRGQEISEEVADGTHSIIFDQAENRLHMQKAILETLLTENSKEM
jgi:ornithine carbamoyltransferase